MKTSEGTVSLSLIVATVDRTEELARLIRSVAVQDILGIELIVVDQNHDDRVESLLAREARGLRTLHLRSSRGLSLARNTGLAAASGAIVAFPDDDCWYPENLLQQVLEWFGWHPKHALFCCAMRDEKGSEVAARWPSRSQVLNSDSVLRAAASASLFFRREVVQNAGGFDERLGLGSGTPFESGEDTDLAIRCLEAGPGWFEKHLFVLHPRRDPAQVSRRRALAYGIGFGYILRTHNYPLRTLLYHLARAVGGMLRALLLLRRAEAGFYLQSARGRWMGYGWLRRPLDSAFLRGSNKHLQL